MKRIQGQCSGKELGRSTIISAQTTLKHSPMENIAEPNLISIRLGCPIINYNPEMHWKDLSTEKRMSRARATALHSGKGIFILRRLLMVRYKKAH